MGTLLSLELINIETSNTCIKACTGYWCNAYTAQAKLVPHGKVMHMHEED
jgi:hypothetical protein